jgi:hypothetical protein
MIRIASALNGGPCFLGSNTRSGISEFDEALPSEDIWEFLDIMETYIAEELDGVIYSFDEGFFELNNKPILAFP